MKYFEHHAGLHKLNLVPWNLLMRINYLRIPVLSVMLALGHFYFNDGLGKSCVYKMVLPSTNWATFCLGKHARCLWLAGPIHCTWQRPEPALLRWPSLLAVGWRGLLETAVESIPDSWVDNHTDLSDSFSPHHCVSLCRATRGPYLELCI